MMTQKNWPQVRLNVFTIKQKSAASVPKCSQACAQTCCSPKLHTNDLNRDVVGGIFAPTFNYPELDANDPNGDPRGQYFCANKSTLGLKRKFNKGANLGLFQYLL